MSVNSIGANTSVNTAKAATAKKKMDPVKKGALIAGGIAVGMDTVSLALGNVATKSVCDKSVVQIWKENGGVLKNVAKMIPGIAITVAIGAGIGKLVKNHQEKEDAE